MDGLYNEFFGVDSARAKHSITFAQLTVIFASLETPDLFKDGAEVVLEGRLRTGEPDAFLADKLMAKCPSKFEGQQTTAGDGAARG